MDLLEKFMTVLLILISIAVFYQVMSRHLSFFPTYMFTAEISNYLLLWLVFIGTAVGVGKEDHFDIDIFEDYLKKYPKIRKLQLIISKLLILSFSIFILIFGWNFVEKGLSRTSLTLPTSLFWVYISYYISGILMFIFQINNLVKLKEKQIFCVEKEE